MVNFCLKSFTNKTGKCLQTFSANFSSLVNKIIDYIVAIIKCYEACTEIITLTTGLI